MQYENRFAQVLWAAFVGCVTQCMQIASVYFLATFGEIVSLSSSTITVWHRKMLHIPIRDRLLEVNGGALFLSFPLTRLASFSDSCLDVSCTLRLVGSH